MKHTTELVFILDRSGSMSGLETDTIGGFNSMIAKQKKEAGEALVSTVLFDNESVVIHDRLPLEDVPPMTEKEYFTLGCTALLDAVVLAVVSREEEGTYGYKITQEIKQALELSESTLYPVLRRLQKDGCLTIYDEPFNGRNRRYYKITPLGRLQLAGYNAEWKVYAANIDHIFGEDAK